jgi:hypothetical protein
LTVNVAKTATPGEIRTPGLLIRSPFRALLHASHRRDELPLWESRASLRNIFERRATDGCRRLRRCDDEVSGRRARYCRCALELAQGDGGLCSRRGSPSSWIVMPRAETMILQIAEIPLAASGHLGVLKAIRKHFDYCLINIPACLPIFSRLLPYIAAP